MKKDKEYLPVDVYTMFDISKSTLFRWEKEEGFPPLSRGENGERLYNNEHIRWLGNKKVASVKRQYNIAARNEDLERMEELHRLITKYKILYLDDETGLQELQYISLSSEMIKELLHVAIEHDPTDDVFKKIIMAIYKQTVD